MNLPDSRPVTNRALGARRAVLLAVLLLLAIGRVPALNIAVSVAGATPKNWDVGSFGPGSIALAGDDFVSIHSGPQVTIDVTSVPRNKTVQVTVSKPADEGTTWGAGYQLWVRRVSDGTGTSITWTSTGWIQVTSTATALFDAVDDRTGVVIELELRGLSVAAGTTTATPSFMTTVTYIATRI